MLNFEAVSEEKIRVSIVNYTNTLPFKWALKRSPLLSQIDLQEDIPSICAQKLMCGQNGFGFSSNCFFCAATNKDYKAIVKPI